MDSRLSALIAAEDRALEMLAAIDAAGLVAPGRRESEVDADIAALAERDYGVTRHWHKRLVRAGGTHHRSERHGLSRSRAGF